jgi:hypothetical protein
MVGKIVQITFWDHSMSSGAEAEPILCTVWGLVTGESKIHYVVTTWKAHQEEASAHGHNDEVFSIIKSTITEFLIFGKGKNKRK